MAFQIDNKKERSSDLARLSLIENNNNESYISSVGDSADSASNAHVIAASASSPKSSDLVNSARKSAGLSEDRNKATGNNSAMMHPPLIESAVVPTLEHEVKGSY